MKGGHLPGVEGDTAPAPPVVADVLFDGSTVTVLEVPCVDSANTHGTGCTLSAAIAGLLARGLEVPDAVAEAKAFVAAALAGAASWRLGAGHGPLDPFGWSGTGHSSGRVVTTRPLPPPMSQDPPAWATRRPSC